MSTTATKVRAAEQAHAAASDKSSARTPLSSIFIVLTEAVDGQVDEFNDWYTNIHCHDTMRLKGSVAVQRWKLSPYQLRYNAAHVGPPQRWLCIYELNDTQQNIDDHVAQCFTEAMPITSAQKIESAEDFYYVAVVPGKTAVETYASRGGDVLTIRMNALPGKEAEFIRWYRETDLPRTLKLIGFVAGDLYRVADIQLIDAPPRFQFTAVYHVADPMVAVESLDSHLAQAGTLLDCPFVDTAGVRIGCYTPITNRFTAEQALNLPPAQKALEDRFRANMGDRIHVGEAVGGLKIKRD
jgi:hypothetical protein